MNKRETEKDVTTFVNSKPVTHDYKKKFVLDKKALFFCNHKFCSSTRLGAAS